LKVSFLKVRLFYGFNFEKSWFKGFFQKVSLLNVEGLNTAALIT